MSYESEKRAAAEAKANEGKKFLTREETDKKTFKPKEDNETFRILPTPEGETAIETAHFHEVTVNGFSQTIYCPKHNDGKECALCDEYERLLATQTKDNPNYKDKENPITIANNEIFKKAVKFKASEYHIIKGVDKGTPKDGVKFWRSKDNKKKEGVFDKIEPLIESYYKKHNKSLADIKDGVDLEIKTVWDTIPSNGVKYRKVTSIVLSDQIVLDGNPKKVEEWVNDPITWRDVFRPNTLPGLNVQQYLQAIIDDKIPVWNKESRQWEQKTKVVDEAKTIKVEASNKSLTANVEDITPTATPSVSGKVVAKEKPAATVKDETDDLPF